MKNIFLMILTFLFALTLFSFNGIAQAKELIKIESIVIDESGNPIEGAEISSGAAFEKTDAKGGFSIATKASQNIIIEANGYEPVSLKVSEAMQMPRVTLVRSEFGFGADNIVNVAFRESKEGQIAGAISVLDPDEIGKFDNTIWASNVLAGRTLGMYGSNSVRGIGIGLNVADITGTGLESGNALFIVDGLPRDIENLRLSEIESITVLKDVNTAVLYGSSAVNGVVLITTKRGKAYKQKSDFAVNYGISTPVSYPKYLNSSDYMTYFNQARLNDGLTEQFSDEDIENHRSGNPYRYPDVDYYSDDLLKGFKSYFDLVAQFSGGNDVAQFYTNFGWNSRGGILDFGEGMNARDNTFNVRGNVDLKVNDFIKTSIDGSAIFMSDTRQRGNYWNDASNIRPYEYTPLIPYNLISQEEGNPALAAWNSRKRDVEGMYLIGGNSNHLRHPFGDGYAGGTIQTIQRKFSFNNRIDADLSMLTEGLSFHTNFSFDYILGYDQTILNEYSVYQPIWNDSTDVIVDINQHGKDTNPGSQNVGQTNFIRRFGFYGLLKYSRLFNDIHRVEASLLGYGSNFRESGSTQGVKQAHLGLQATYTYANRYVIDFSSAYVNSVKLAEGNRGGFSPSLGLGWIMSNEDFISAEKIDFMKLKLSAGVINSDMPIGGFFYYDNRYGGTGGYSWYDGTRSRGGTRSSWSANQELGYAKRKELNVGFEGIFFNHFLGVEANLFYDIYSDLVTRPVTRYPSFYTDFIPYENFGEDRYQGAEVGVNISKKIGEFDFMIGANILYVTSERTKVDEVYDNQYQYREGQPRDASFGLEAIGFFENNADIESSPIQAFGAVKPGDIKYKDQNGDGIVDQNDEIYLRRWQSPFSGGLQLRLSYKDLTLYVLGEGRQGAKSFKEGNYWWVDGNDKYSEVVRGAWTTETASTATYPRLSSQTNSNNFRRSSFWLYDNSYFQIDKIQLTYTMPDFISKTLLMKNLDVFVDAANVIQFAKDLEMRELRVGSEPLYRTFSAGIKANF